MSDLHQDSDRVNNFIAKFEVSLRLRFRLANCIERGAILINCNNLVCFSKNTFREGLCRMIPKSGLKFKKALV